MSLPPELMGLGSMYGRSMDANILLSRSMADITTLRRCVVKNDLVHPYKELMDEDRNPPSPAWLAGEDVHGGMPVISALSQLRPVISAPPQLRPDISVPSRLCSSGDRGPFHQLLAVGRWFPPGTPVSSTRKLISSSFHRLDMTLAVAEALNPNKPNQTLT